MPFDFYKTIEVKPGGYPAEFGRATGGVINAVTKSGTNDFYFGLHGNYEPDFAKEREPNTYQTLNSRNRRDVSQTNVEFGGPLIRDHLFFYGLYQLNNSITESGSVTNHNFYKQRDNSPFYGYKIDGYLTSRQHFEFTDFNTSDTRNRNTYNLIANPAYAPVRGVPATAQQKGAYVHRVQFPTRGDKAVRAPAIRARMSMRGLYIPGDAPWRKDSRPSCCASPRGCTTIRWTALPL